MSRYDINAGTEGEHEPGSRGLVLRNVQHITSRRVIDQCEFELLLAARKKYLGIVTADTQFTVEFILKMHRDWLGKLYLWAGQFRTVELAKSEFRWPPARLIPQNMKNLEANLLSECTPCRGDAQEVAHAIAQVHAELLLIHPFREGNGRVSRWLADLMALQAGFPLPRYGFIGHGSSRRKAEYLAAVGQGYIMNYEPLADFFAVALERGRF